MRDEEDIDSQQFQSCRDKQSNFTNQRQNSQVYSQKNSNNQITNSQTSFKTAIDMTNRQQMMQNQQQQQIYNQGFNQNMFMDSQRQVSAPVEYKKHQSYMQNDIQSPYTEQDQHYIADNTMNAKELLTITIELGQGKSANITIRENDDPNMLAANFAQEYGLNQQLQDLLSDQIRMNMEQVIEEELAQNYQNTEETQDISTQNLPRQTQQPWQYDKQEQSMEQKQQSNMKQMNIYQNPFYNPPLSNKGSKSFIDDQNSGINKTNQSFYTDRSGNNTSQSNIFQQPLMKNQVNKEMKKLQTLSPSQHQPYVSENSKRIASQKRNESNRTSIHQRLHQEALIKQRTQKQQIQNQDLSQQLGGSTKINRSLLGQTNYSNCSTPGKNMPMGQYQMMQQLGQVSKPPRSSSLQNNRKQQQQIGGDMSTINSKQNTTQGKVSQYVNYGERLYQKGVKRREEIERHLKEAKSQKEKESLDQHSFQPQINDVSKLMARPQRQKAEDSLLSFGKQAKEKIEQKRSQQMHQELDQCKFHPNISKKTERIMTERLNGQQQFHRLSNSKKRNSLDKFNNLYDDAKRRQERQEKIYSQCMESDCTFQPDTNNTKSYNSRIQEDGNPDQFYERLNKGYYPRQRSASLQKVKNNNEDLFDQETGQSFFQPRVGRGPLKQQRPDPKSGQIGNMLYDSYKQQQERLSMNRQQHQTEKSQKLNSVFTKDQTNRIVERAKIKKFIELFNQLDSDRDGQISSQRIDISQLQPELLEILTPLFCEMEELGQTLDEDEFIDALGRLYDSVSLPEKNIILQKNQHREKSQSKYMNNQNQFKPQLNENSLRIASKNRPKNADVSSLLYQKRQEYDMKIYEKQQEKENLELVGCTFQPKTLQSPGSEINTSRNRSYQRQAMMMLNNSQYSNNHSNGTFDLNNLAQNVANDLQYKQALNPNLNNQRLNIQLNQDVQQNQPFQTGFNTFSSNVETPQVAANSYNPQLMMMH